MDLQSDTPIADSRTDTGARVEEAGTGGFGWLRRIMWTVGIIAGLVTTCLGLVVVLGWHTGNRTLIQVMPQFVPMQYNTALGFIFAGSALTMLVAGRRKLAVSFGAVTAIIGGLTLVEYVGGVSLGIDELFMVHDITTKTSHPGRMAPNTAACFTLIGLAAVIRRRHWSPIRQSVVTVVLASLTFGLAVVALSGYVAQLETAYGWGNLTRMAVHTSAGFTIASLGMLAWIWSGDKTKHSWLPEWMPIPTLVAVLTATLCLWQAVSAEGQRIHREHEDVTSLSGLSTLILVVGTLLAVALALVAFLAQQASIRSAQLKEHRDSLEDSVEDRTKELRRINFLSDIALELTECGYWHVDYSDPDYYYQSEQAAKILGEKPKPDGRYHLQNEWFARLVEADPQAAEKTAERYQGAIDGRYGHYESTYAYKRPVDGRVVWIHALGQIVRDDAGKIQYMYGVYQDITESVQAAEALRKAEGRVMMLLNSAPVGIVLVDREGIIQSANEEVERMFGYEQGELIGTQVDLLTPHSIRDQHADLRGSFMANPGRRVLGRDRGLKGVRKDGSEMYVEIGLAPLETPEGLMVTAAIHDISDRMEAEEALRKSEERFDLTVRGSGDGMWDFPATGELWYADRFRELLGYSDEEDYPNVIESWSDGLHPEDRDATLDAFKAHLEGDVPYDVVYRLKMKTGEYRWFRARGISLRDESGTSYRSAGSITDIHDQKMAEAGLAAAEERSRLLLESTGEGIFGVDAHGEITFVNAAAASLLGYDRAELLDNEVHKLVHHSRANGTPYPVEECPMYHAFTEGVVSTVNNEVLWRKDGSCFDAEYTSVPIRKDSEIIGAVVVFRDVTERRKNEGQLRKLSRAVEQSSSTIVITDTQGVIEYVNPQFTAVTGYTAEEAIGQNPRVLKGDQLSAEFYEDLWKTIASGNDWRGEFCNKKKNGDLFWESASISPIRSTEGDITHYVAVKEDITERKQIQEELLNARQAAEDANQAKSAFLANMSHELRTPMNAIIGYSEMLMEEAEDLEPEELIPDLQKIHGAGKHLLSLINDILDLSKIEAGKMDLYMETFGLDGMIDEVGATVDTLIKKNGNKLVIDSEADLGEMRADLTKVRQSLLNLLSNAAKFTENGTITLGAKREQDGDGEEWISISVADTGIGVPEDKLHKLFDEFSQADASTTRKYGGTGLGLAITRRFCQMMGGDITLKSVEGEGSCFTIRLPIAPRPSVADGASPDAGSTAGTTNANLKQDEQTQRTDPTDSTTTRGTVLVVDDDASNRDLLNRHLLKDGFTVIQAVDGLEALKLAKQHQPDVITLDVLMPSMDGWTVLKILKDDPDTHDIPVIIVSMVDDKNLGYTLGATEYLTKPIDHKRLSQLLDRYRPLVAGGDVLVIEDDPGTREMIRRLLEGEGLAVREAANGREGLEAMSQMTPSLVVLDLMMPVMDGFEFVVQMRKDKSYDLVPVVVVTAKDLTQAEREALHGGVTKVLQKGTYSRDELLQLVSQSVTRTSNTSSQTEGHDA